MIRKILLLCSLTFPPLAAGMQPSSEVPWKISDCPHRIQVELDRLLRIELDRGKLWAPRLHALCVEGQLQLRVVSTTRTLIRALPLHVSNDVSAREAALASIELIRAAQLEIIRGEPPRLETASRGLAPTPALRAQPASIHLERSAFRLAFLADARRLSSGTGLGFGLSFYDPHWEWGGWEATLLAHRNAGESALGEVHIDDASTSVALLASRTRGRWDPRAGLGMRLGILKMTGQPSDPQQIRGGSIGTLWGGPFAEAGVTLILGRIGLEARLEEGWYFGSLAATAQTSQQISASGAWTLFSVGASISML